MCLEGRGSSRDPDQQETYDRFRVKSTGQWRVVLTRQDKFETQVHQSPCESDNRKEDEEAKVCDAKQTDMLRSLPWMHANEVSMPLP